MGMSSFVLGFHELEPSQHRLVGGKALNLGELSKIHGVHVPEGFCVTTAAFQKAVEPSIMYHELLDRLSKLNAEDREQIDVISRQIRQTIMDAAFPAGVVQAVDRSLSRFGEDHAYAIRSSATAEDLPHASFAGQLDTYLNVIGKESILRHIRKCWASLFTDRAILYRKQNGFDDKQVYISVIVQKMIFPRASGILFTADPLTCNRKVLSIDAGFGLGEALVSGMVSADSYQVRNGKIVGKRIAGKTLAIYGRKGGGTETKQLDPVLQKTQTLTDQQILQLARLGRQIEAYFGRPQDIEWSLAGDTFYVLQSRPITTLYPIPEATDQENHVYVSVGHQQMMTDAMKPLGLSFYLLTSRAPMHAAGGRLFVDVTKPLSSPESREMILNALGESDPLIRDALMTVIERGDFIQTNPIEPNPSSPRQNKGASFSGIQTEFENDPAIVSKLIMHSQTSLEALKLNIQSKSGSDLFHFILEDLEQLRKQLFDPQSMGVIMAAMNAAKWINEKMNEWLGEKNAADPLSQSVPNNITSEMGLALLDVADAIRPYPEVIQYLQEVKADSF
jgi:pyruvate,water dikinase